MKDKTNYKLLLIPIISSIILTILVIVISINQKSELIATVYEGWVGILVTYVILSIASISLKKITISFLPLFMMIIYNILSLVMLPKNNMVFLLITIILLIYSIGMIIFNIKISKSKHKAS
jgi:hypothetical protein